MTCDLERPVFGYLPVRSPAWDGGARSVISFAADGFFGFACPPSVAGAIVGINSNALTYYFTSIEYGVHFQRGQYRVIEGGAHQTAWAPYSATDTFYLFRRSGVVYYVRATNTAPEYKEYDSRLPGIPLPGPIIYVSARESYGIAYLDASLYEVNDFVFREQGGDVWLPANEAGTDPENTAMVAGHIAFDGAAAATTSGAERDWLPTDLASGATVWLDASDATTVTLDSTAVTQWDDKSGNDRHASNSSGSDRPTYANGAINYPDTVGAQTYLEAAVPVSVLDGDHSITLVFEPYGAVIAGSFYEGLIDAYINDGDPFAEEYTLLRYPKSDRQRHDLGYWGDYSTTANNDWLNSDTGAKVFTMSRSGNTLTVRENGLTIITADVTGVSSGSSGDATLRIGEAMQSTAQSIRGMIHSVTVAPTAAASDIELLEGWAAHAAGVEAVLDSGHTYASAAPTTQGSGAQPVGAAGGGSIAFGVSASTATDTGVFAGGIAFGGFAGAALSAWARGSIAFGGGLGTGAAGSDGFQEGTQGKVNGYTAFRLDGYGGQVYTDGVFAGEIAFHGQASAGSGAIVAGGIGFELVAFGTEDVGNALIITLPGFGVLATRYEELLADTLTTADDAQALNVLGALIMDTVLAASHVDARTALKIADGFIATAAVRRFSRQEVLIASVAGVTDRVRLAFAVELADVIEALDGNQQLQQASIADALIASGAVTTRYQATALVMAAAEIADRRIVGYSDELVELVRAEDELAVFAQYMAALNDVITAADAWTVQRMVIVQVADAAEIADSSVSLQTFIELIADGAEVLVFSKTIGGVTANGWLLTGRAEVTGLAVNTEGMMPASVYTNYEFNGLAFGNGIMLGGNDEGLFLLEGDTDDGDEFVPYIQTLKIDFGTSRQKRVRAAYVGYTGDGRVILKVRTGTRGKLVEDWYEATLEDAYESADGVMVDVGHGLKSRYWQFTLAQIDGTEFEVDQLELYPVALRRRT